MKKPFVCGNWKLHHYLEDTERFIQQLLLERADWEEKAEVVLAPVATALFAASKLAKDSLLKVASQNVFYESEGAYTGEWSVGHLRELGCRYSIVGHSERRQYFHETSETVSKKVSACLKGGLTPILCLGESLQERQNDYTKNVLAAQLAPVFSQLADLEPAEVILAYEPVWAIGTGHSATPDQANEVHQYLRHELEKGLGKVWSNKAQIIYGGSVKPQNAAELIAESDIDGFLVGKASLNVDSFLSIIQKSYQG